MGSAAGGVDLHLHSTCSDGIFPPARVIELAAEAGLHFVSLTDHDTLEGWAEAADRGQALGVEVLPGVEISCRLPEGGERHLLGYGVDPGHAGLAAALDANRRSRFERLDRIIAALADAGVRLEREQVLAEAAGCSVGRPHVADALVRIGKVRSRQEAFDRWLADGKVAAVRYESLGAAEAIQWVQASGGVAVLAHPGRRRRPVDFEVLAGLGLDGVEVIHPSHGPDDVKMLSAEAARRGLLATGGSDCHGDREGLAVLRARRVPATVEAELKDCLQRRRALLDPQGGTRP